MSVFRWQFFIYTSLVNVQYKFLVKDFIDFFFFYFGFFLVKNPKKAINAKIINYKIPPSIKCYQI